MPPDEKPEQTPPPPKNETDSLADLFGPSISEILPKLLLDFPALATHTLYSSLPDTLTLAGLIRSVRNSAPTSEQSAPAPQALPIASSKLLPEAAPVQRPAPQIAPRGSKGDPAPFANKTSVTFPEAEAYLELKSRQRQILMKDGDLEFIGKGPNRRITTASLFRRLPPIQK